MIETGYYPAGTEHCPDAPWNKKEQKPQKVNVLVSVTLSKTMEVEVTDYKQQHSLDEEGNPITDYDFSECDLKKAIEEQRTLPNEAYDKLWPTIFNSESFTAFETIEDLKDWDVDDYEVMLDD